MTRKREVELVITSLGSGGDGVAEVPDGRAYIPYSLPGEKIRARLERGVRGRFEGECLEILQASPERVPPPCPYFGQCGGCQLQHLEETAYRKWMREVVRTQLGRQGLGHISVPLPNISPPGTRRRAKLHFRKQGKEIEIGFRRKRQHSLQPIDSCLVLDPQILPFARKFIAALSSYLPSGKSGALSITRTDTGPDLVLEGLVIEGFEAREAVASLCRELDIARLHLSGSAGLEPFYQVRVPRVHFEDIPISLPPLAFLRASGWGERRLQQFVATHVKGAKHIADLFSGCGTFSLPLAKKARITAFDSDREMIEALNRAAQEAPGLKGVKAQARDLFKRPLLARELRDFDAVIFDPPRAGARQQTIEISRSEVPVVIAISCHGASFARDARALMEGGYEVQEMALFDQFLWSSHVELAAVFHSRKAR